MFSGQCFVHTADSTELTAHTAGITVVIFRKTVITDSFGCFRIKSTVKLCIPVKDTAGICHLVIDISRMRDSFGNICRMGCNLGSNNSLFDIFYIRKSQMFCRCYIAEESST